MRISGGFEHRELSDGTADPSGSVRWASAALPDGYVPYGYPAVLGWNGSVYIVEWNGGNEEIVGFDQKTGAITLADKAFGFITGLYAYDGGLIVIDGYVSTT